MDAAYRLKLAQAVLHTQVLSLCNCFVLRIWFRVCNVLCCINLNR